MKIHADKIESGPGHCLSARDIKLILATIPKEWAAGITDVRLANGTGPRAYMFWGEGRLTIYSRYCAKKDVLLVLLSALAAPSLNITNCVARSPSAGEQHRLNQAIQPFVDKILFEMSAADEKRRSMKRIV